MPHPDSRPVLADPMLPMQGLTLLVVEDSRYASEAFRLMAQRSGARLRRAETLADARRHLAIYRPDVVIVDMGLPDGSGAGLIRELALAGPDRPVVLGLSGDPGQRATALAAGALGFLEKPVAGLAGFQAEVLRHLPDRAPVGMVAEAPEPDRLALREDLAHAADLLAQGPDAGQRAYLARFLGGIARSTRDTALARAAEDLPYADGARLAYLSGLVALRMGDMPRPFA